MTAEEQLIASYDFQKGATLLVDKPKDWTSFDVVNKIRYALRQRLGVKKIKVGHAGTLDPMATGLLIICTGKATKSLADLQGLSKMYTGTMLFGGSTPSYDAETEVDQHFPIDHISDNMIEQARQQFLGDIDQVPPMFSAIKVDGQPLYKKARKGESIEIKARRVHIYSLEFTCIALPEVDFRVHCSKGTYIRSLAHDLGGILDSGAHLTALKRTRVGEFHLEDAWELEKLITLLGNP
ncbi:MAG: tRNA pseudouridine(55) synthase TruB [Sinomicrobium sp.]|nr:tRNA pseudouridine(55) synthase TruB [Sinomicrobium sp.]